MFLALTLLHTVEAMQQFIKFINNQILIRG